MDGRREERLIARGKRQRKGYMGITNDIINIKEQIIVIGSKDRKRHTMRKE